MLDIILSSAANRFLRKADNATYDRIIKKINEIAEDPFPQGVERIVGRPEKTFRARVGDYRILYSIFFEKKELLIDNIAKRSHAYD